MDKVDDIIPTIRYHDPLYTPRTGREKWPLQGHYENNTYIDWMKESNRESGSQLSLKKWLTLIGFSLLVGYATVIIDLFSVFLNDLRKGLCFSSLDTWSLLNPYLTCPADHWYDWLQIISGSGNIVVSGILGFPIYLSLVLVFSMTAGYLTMNRAPMIKQSGIPELKLIISGFNYYLKSYLGARTLLYKIICLSLVVGSGFWLGIEGPLVHISCCILSICFDAILRDHASEGMRRELLSAATATGIAVAFNSPIGGVLFVVELLPSYFMPTKIMWNSFVSATVALVALNGVRSFTDGENFQEEDLFEVLFGNFSWLFLEIIPFLLLGVLGGIFGHLYTKMYLKFSDPHLKQRLWKRLAVLCRIQEKNGRYAELFLVAIATALLTFTVPLTKMPLGAFLKILFKDCPKDDSSLESNSENFMCQPSTVITLFKLIYILLQGFCLSAYAYGLLLPGGILMPSLVLGGTVGRFVGIISQAIQKAVEGDYLATCTAKSCLVSPSSHAVVGAAAFMSGITKLTLCVVVIIFELTGAISYVLPIMIAVLTSKFVNDQLSVENVYDAWLSTEFNHIGETGEVNSNKGHGLCSFANLSATFKARLPDVTVKTIMVPLPKTRKLYVCPHEPYTLSSLYAFLSEDAHEGYPVIYSDDKPLSLGYVTKKHVYLEIASVIGNTQPTSAVVSFQASLPPEVRAEQEEYEQDLSHRYANVHLVTLEVEKPIIIVKDNTPLKQVIEIVERLHINHLVLTEHKDNNRMCGFIDRFILSRLVTLRFSELQHEMRIVESVASEFEIGDGDETVDEDANFRRQRESIELLT